jgi:hypothetical protein
MNNTFDYKFLVATAKLEIKVDTNQPISEYSLRPVCFLLHQKKLGARHVAHACNSNYSGGGDHGLRPAWAKKLLRTYLKKQAGCGGVPL